MKDRRLIKLTAVLGVLVLMLTLFVPTALAFETLEGKDVVIGADEVIDDDLFVAAETFVLNGTVNGDLFVVGGEITIRGTVTGDVWAVGQSVSIIGSPMDDVWIAGYALELDPGAQIGDDLRAAGFSFLAQGGSRVGGSFFFGGYQALLGGDIGEDAVVGSAGLEIQGTIMGNVSADVGPRDIGMIWNPTMFFPEIPPVPAVPVVSGGLTLGSNARIGGDLDYTAPEEIDIPSGAVAGRTTFTLVEPEVEEEFDVPLGGILGGIIGGIFAGWVVNTVRMLVALLIVALLVAWLAPRWLTRPAEIFKAQPWPSLGWGALVFILFPLVVFALLAALVMIVFIVYVITLGKLALPAGIIGGAAILLLVVFFSLVVVYLTKIMAGYVLGRLLFAGDEWEQKPILPTLVGVLILGMLTRIPFVGWLFSLAIALFGLGALWLLAREELAKKA